MLAAALLGAFALCLFWSDAPPTPRQTPGQKLKSEPRPPDEGTAQATRKPSPPSHDYVGSAACAECHAQIAKAYQSHPMAHSLWDVSAAPPIEDYDEKTSFAPDGRHHYSVERDAGTVRHHERLTDEDGETLYDQAAPVAYAVGSGAQGRSYLIDRGGSLFMSPISWYSNTKQWGLSPGYKLPHHRRFDRRVTVGCMDCHAGRLNAERGSDNRFGSPAFLEYAIGCERCHGPGARHVDYQRAPDPDEEDPIVNPARLDPAPREDICAQCHLQGRGRVPHYGQQLGDFRPGQRLEETCVVFVDEARAEPDGTTRAVSHVEQMRASTCFRESGGRFGCTSCHDPHSQPAESEKWSFYREKCLQCHETQGCRVPESERRLREPNDSCVNCHMPRLGGSDVPHTSHTDHRVPREPKSRPRTEHMVDALPEIYDNAATRLPRLTVNRARGLWLSDLAEQKTDPALAARALLLLSSVARDNPHDADVFDALGTVSAVERRFEDSLKYWEQALKIDPHREQTLRTRALLLQNLGRTEAALPEIEKYLQRQPWDASMWGRYSHILGRSGQWDRAITAAHKAEEFDPSVPRVYQWLAQAYQQMGDESRSRHYLDLFERISRQPAK